MILTTAHHVTCEAIRWWRVIYDESHVLRTNSKSTSAAKSLIAENKWLVTGETRFIDDW